MNNQCCKINVLSLGLAIGVLWGVTTFLMALIAMTGFAREFVNITGSFYWGYGPTIMGSVIGLVWGFVDGFIGGALLAILYNYFQKFTGSVPSKSA